MNQIGAKAQNLIRMRDEFGLNVPRFLVAGFDQVFLNWPALSRDLTQVAREFIGSKITDEEATAKNETLLESAELSRQTVSELLVEGTKLGFSRVSFRTSAASEDSGAASFAGMYESFLDQTFTSEHVEHHARACLASLVSARVLNYGREQGILDFTVGGSMVIQEMFFGETSGVLFTEDGRGSLLLASNQQWANSVVVGENATELRIDRQELVAGKLDRTLPRQVLELCRGALRLEDVTSVPVDVEWSYDRSQLAWLQYRPQTTPFLDHTFEWDSTNISENYPGITLPLTYSMIRRLYAGVYLEFFRLVGATDKEIRQQAPVLDNMLGYLNGRVYYRITTWYQAIKLMPGRRNQEYFEAMLNPVRKRGGSSKSTMDARSILTGIRFAWLVLNSERLSRKFAKAIQPKIAFYEQMPVAFIAAPVILDQSKRIRVELLGDWAIPILNDVRLMIYHGALKRLFAESSAPNAYLSLIQGLSDRASVKPLANLTELGQQLRERMLDLGVSDVAGLRHSAKWPDIAQSARSYVQEFGARTPGELKLENRRITDDIQAILELALKAADSGITHRPEGVTTGGVDFEWPSGFNWLKRRLALHLARNTKQAIDWRERFRFNRAQTFNLSRRAFDAIGAVLASEGTIETARDIYWLTDQEVDDLVNCHAPTNSAVAVVADRKLEFAKYEKLETGLAMQGHGRIASHNLVITKPLQDGHSTIGSGVAPGVVTAPSLVMLEFDATADVRGKILVVEFIDPGWTLLFTQALGVITERGNALSHAAIISREIGIPAIVGLVGATHTFKSGQTITMNGTTGVVEIE